MYKRLFFYLFYPLAFLLSVPVVKAQSPNWQWSVLVNHTLHEQIPSRAYLWVPADCKRIKAVIFAQNNMEEQSVLENTNFRKAMARLGVAEVWVSPAYDLMFNFDKGAGDVFNGIMNDLADVSGYTELRYVPFIGMGHSAAASAPYYMAAWNPERALAAISVSGQWPYFRHPSFAPDVWGKRTIDFIPCLETMGEYEAANTWSAEGLLERQQHPLMPLSMLASPAQGHFAATDAKCSYIALYIKKAIQYRMPTHTPDDVAPKLIPVNPTKSGWLVDKWRYDQKSEAPAGPVNKYSGDPQQAFWFFDEEMARATIEYEATHRFQKSQLIGYVQDGKMVAQYNTHQQVNLKFEPEADGLTFKLHAAFYDTVGSGSPRLAMWANMPAGSAIGHATDGGPIVIDRITGPVIKVDDSTFRLNPQQGFWQDPHSYELWFAATHPGDKDYKPAVQQAQMLVPPRNKDGKEQHITFLPVADQRPGAKNIRLQAVSDAKVPVSFYVQDGPAVIQGNTLNLTPIPPKSKFPVKVTIVAWQYGNSNEPKLQTAEPVERVFWINK
jgi:hypothetical protein